MALSDSFKAELAEAYRELGRVQQRLASLKGQADLDNLPPAVGITLAKKHGVLKYTREDLAEIPKIVARDEARR